MRRREFLQAGAAASLGLLLPRVSPAKRPSFDPRPGPWRSFELVTRVEIQKPSGRTRVWLPVPSVEDAGQKLGGNTWTGNAKSAVLARDPEYGASLLHAEWEPDAAAPVLELTSRFSTRDRATDFSKPVGAASLSAAERELYTRPTELIPTDGIVARTSAQIVGSAASDVDRARRIYDWIVENTHRDPAIRGCGVGDVRSMLEQGDLGGKCADLNALYVGLVRAAGVPARDLYGIRVAKSEFGYKVLGASSENVTRSQHCRAEVFLEGFGWTPVDPADVGKVVLEERGAPIALGDPIVEPVRAKLFGAWEGNWLAFNTAHDVALPGSRGAKLGFLMYPQAETDQGRIDCLDPDGFRYQIGVREVRA